MAVKISICLFFIVMSVLALLLQPANCIQVSPSMVDDAVNHNVGLDALERSEKNTSGLQDTYAGTGIQAAKGTLDIDLDIGRPTTPHNADTEDYDYSYHDEDEEHDLNNQKNVNINDTKTEAKSRVSPLKEDEKSWMGIHEGGVTDVNVQVEGIDEHRGKNITELKNDIGGGQPVIDDLDLKDDDSYEYAYENEPELSVPISTNQDEPKNTDYDEDNENKDVLKEFDFHSDKGTKSGTDAAILTATLPDSAVAKLTEDANRTQNISILNSAVAIQSERLNENSFNNEKKEISPFVVGKDVIKSASQYPKAEVDTSDEDITLNENDHGNDANKESNENEDIDGIDDINPVALTEPSNHDQIESDENDYKVSNGVGITSVNDDYESYDPENMEGNAEEEVHLPVTTSWSDIDEKVNDHDDFNKKHEDYWYDYAETDYFGSQLPMKENAPATETNSQADAQDSESEIGNEKGPTQEQPEGEMVIDEEDSQKQLQAPKSTIILYTALIIALIAGIVLITIWKGPFKILRRRSSSNLYLILQGDDDRKKLMDQPFV